MQHYCTRRPHTCTAARETTCRVDASIIVIVMAESHAPHRVSALLCAHLRDSRGTGTIISTTAGSKFVVVKAYLIVVHSEYGDRSNFSSVDARGMDQIEGGYWDGWV
eukprot:IDg18162t1